MVHLHFSVRGICALLSVVGSVITSRIIASQVYCYHTHHRILFFEVTEPMATPVSCEQVCSTVISSRKTFWSRPSFDLRLQECSGIRVLRLYARWQIWLPLECLLQLLTSHEPVMHLTTSIRKPCR